MRKIFILLLVTIAFPTTINAEEIFLSCRGSSPRYPYFEVLINTKTNSVKVKGTKGKRARLNQSEGNFLIRKYESFDGPYHVINILRMTGDFYIDLFTSYDSLEKKLSGSGRCYKTPPTERAF
tara:strand:+ start:1059 stop:1427 length:369 start_codon:yes stop_codon:yes gene_type:complete